jgi:hypothetical protein
MKRTKKGITLVELVICCAIIVLIGGAATALLMSGEHLFSSSADSASNQMELDVLQSHMMNIIPSAKNIGIIETDEDNDLLLLTAGYCIYFNDADTLIIRTGSKETEIRAVTGFVYQIILAGVPNESLPSQSTEPTTETEPPITARAQFLYTVTFRNGQSYQGGFVINNLSYPVVAAELGTTERDLKDSPICVSIPEVPSATTP